MSMKLLGQTLDIHGGGLDLQFPHHENELAQSESYTGEPFVRYWMHNGLMKIGAGKMSKSQGNEVVVSELLKRHHPETLRFFLLSTHYRRPIDFSDERLDEVRRGLEAFIVSSNGSRESRRAPFMTLKRRRYGVRLASRRIPQASGLKSPVIEMRSSNTWMTTSIPEARSAVCSS